MTETIEQQLRLLAIHRSNLAQLLEQQALHGFATTPLAILNAITLERAAIETTTQTLRTLGVKDVIASENFVEPSELAEAYSVFLVEEQRTPMVIICSSDKDAQAVDSLRTNLQQNGFVVWHDYVDLLPGQEWELETRRLFREAHAIIICFSRAAVVQGGKFHRAIRRALDVAEEEPEGDIFGSSGIAVEPPKCSVCFGCGCVAG